MNNFMTPENIEKYGNAQQADEVGLSATNALLCEIKKLISDGFMTCESTPDHDYCVKIETRRLVDAQKLHRLLIQISST